MDYRIIEKKAFKVTGIVAKISTSSGDHNMRISKFWDECYADGTIEKLLTIDNRHNLLGVTLEFDYINNEITYMIGIEDINNTEPNGFETVYIQSSTWAVFTSTGPLPDALKNLWQGIFQEWYPETGFEHADGPEMEVYFPGNTSAQDYKCEAWTPVVKK